MAIGATYLSEFMPENYKNLVITVMNLIDGCVLVFQSFWYKNYKDWESLHKLGFVFAILMLSLVT